MDIRYSANQRDVKRHTAQELRDEFLIQNLYTANEVVTVYLHMDRMVTLKCMPTTGTVSIDKGVDYWKNFGTHYFLEHHKVDIFNISGGGRIVADGQEFQMRYKDCLHITKGTKEIYFSSGGASAPAKFYMVSAPAHTSYTITYTPTAKAAKRPYRASETANKCVTSQFIHPDIFKTCQLSMDMTMLEGGSIWGTMPTHTHKHRMEVYIYFEMPGDNVIFYMMGEPTGIKRIVMKSEGAVISSSWSMHNDAGTSDCTFIRAMDGENMGFDNMDTVMPNRVK